MNATFRRVLKLEQRNRTSKKKFFVSWELEPNTTALVCNDVVFNRGPEESVDDLLERLMKTIGPSVGPGIYWVEAS